MKPIRRRRRPQARRNQKLQAEMFVNESTIFPARVFISSWIAVKTWRVAGTLGTNSVCDARDHYDLRRASAEEL